MDKQDAVIANLQEGRPQRVPNVRRQERHEPINDFDDNLGNEIEDKEDQVSIGAMDRFVQNGGRREETLASPSVMYPAVLLPAAPLVSSSPSSVSSTANVGLSLKSIRPTDTPPLTLAKSQISLPAKLSTLPTTHSHLSKMAARASRVRSILGQIQRQAPTTSSMKLVDHSPVTASSTTLSIHPATLPTSYHPLSHVLPATTAGALPRPSRPVAPSPSTPTKSQACSFTAIPTSPTTHSPLGEIPLELPGLEDFTPPISDQAGEVVTTESEPLSQQEGTEGNQDGVGVNQVAAEGKAAEAGHGQETGED
ncbi:hypothetical protein LWI28_008640 [Acer negundo]|uniref:Uncharacterized protein n=1 Tax=Acer negundo TaxID=4023 RepID=A0AAD5IMB2_ACENE|nr:hypothetical protein LWI28_008640 [Acer negundo]